MTTDCGRILLTYTNSNCNGTGAATPTPVSGLCAISSTTGDGGEVLYAKVTSCTTSGTNHMTE